MRKLLAFKLTTLRFVDQIQGTFKNVVEEAKQGGQVEISTNSLSLNINKVEHAGFSIYAKLMLLSQEAKHERDTL
jgi:hypothetical protein